MNPIETATIAFAPMTGDTSVSYTTDNKNALSTMVGLLAAQVIADGLLTADDVLTAVMAAVDSEGK